ncbi:MAG TPA: cyclodeaminase/cyclohydrolase family protein [Chloroflexota bacterium]|nr:cyclodeaminase/cyclohydrolase family protein [Chloroflexota bacterium]
MKQGITGAPLGSFLDALASAEPTPGGGAAAAISGAMAAALIAMVCNLTIGRPKFATVEEQLTRVRAESELLRARLLATAEADAQAYGAVAAAYRLPRATADERAARAAAIQNALAGAAQPPLEAMELGRQLLTLALQTAADGNPNVVSDAGVAAELAVATVRAAALMVRANLAELTDPALVDAYAARITTAEARLAEDRDRVVALLRAHQAPKAKR